MLIATIGSMATGTFTVTRTAEGTQVLGRYTLGATSTFTIVAIDQPLDGRVMLPLPEGIRAEEVRLLHTATALRTRDGNGEPDYVTIRGEVYYVWKVAGPYTLGGSTHYEAHVARRKRP